MTRVPCVQYIQILPIKGGGIRAQNSNKFVLGTKVAVIWAQLMVTRQQAQTDKNDILS